MATLVLSALGASLGASLGGSVLGISTAAIGRAVGATVGQAIDQAWLGQTLMGSGSQVVDHGKIDRFRLSGASEGTGIPRIYGRMRVGGQVIWASRFLETVSTSTVETGGKGGGGGSSTTVNEYSYSVSLAMALCEGEIARVGRIWADGIFFFND